MNSTISKQGKLFKKYQKKITNITNKGRFNDKSIIVEKDKDKDKDKAKDKEIKYMDDKNNDNKKNDWNWLDWLKSGEKEGFENEDINSQFTDIKILQDKLENLLAEYQSSQSSLISKTHQYTNVTGNNKYANKYIQFTDGTVCYVTNQGIAKCISTPEIWDSIAGKNGCPVKNVINIGLPWLPEYASAGTIIPTDPPLLSGTCMTTGESCGNAGKNVYVDKMLTNATDKYIGCYRDKPESSLIDIVPKLTVSNSYETGNWESAFNSPGYTTIASSIYLGNNAANGPYKAFDKDKNSFWHSEVSAANNYNSSSGVYEGTSSFQYEKSPGVIDTFHGEYLWIKLNNPQTINSYEITPRQDAYYYRSPNSWTIMGMNPGENWKVLSQESNVDFSTAGRTFNISSPGSYSVYLIGISKVGNASSTSNRYCVQIAEWNLYTSSESSFTNENRAMSLTNGGDYVSFETCKQRAIDGGWKYFGIQDTKDNVSQCAISNDLYRTQIYGEAKDTTWIPIWSSGTGGKAAAGVTLSNDGRLIITEVNTGDIIWSSPNNPASCWWGGHANPDSIQGSFGGNCIGRPVGIDCGRPGNTSYPADGLSGNLNDPLKDYLKKEAEKGESNFSIPSQLLWKGGDPAVCCAKLVDYTYQCGGGPFKSGSISLGSPINIDCSQEVAECGKFKLQLQDDGNMTLFQGENGIWSTGTQGKPPENNTNWIATNGKYGVNYLTTGQVLAPNEWIGSTYGLIILLMQTDGNLVLYSSTTKLNCTQKNDRSYGGSWANAVYEMSDSGVPGNIGKLGYVDSNGVLSEYTQDMIKKTDTYRMLPNTDSANNDFGGMPLNNSNIDQCKTACTTNNNCAGFVFDRSNNNCWLKNGNIYPVGERQINNNLDLYLRNPKIENDSSCSNLIEPIDSISWERYRKSGRNMTKDTTCGLAKVTQPSIQTTNDLKSQIAEISKQIVDKINNLGSSNAELNSEMDQIRSELLGNINKYQTINEEYSKNKRKYLVNINGVLSETDQIVLHQNYSYMFWSILAIGIIVIIMNLKKK